MAGLPEGGIEPEMETRFRTGEFAASDSVGSTAGDIGMRVGGVKGCPGRGMVAALAGSVGGAIGGTGCAWDPAGGEFA